MKKGLTIAYCVLCIAAVIASLVLSCFTVLLSFDVEDIGEEYSASLASVVKTVEISRYGKNDGLRLYNEFSEKVNDSRANGSDGYAFGLSLYNILDSVGTGVKLADFAAQAAESGNTDVNPAIRANIRNLSYEIDMNDIDTAYLILSVKSSLASEFPIYSAVSLAGFIGVLCFTPLFFLLMLLIFILITVSALVNAKRFLYLGNLFGQILNAAILGALLCIAVFPAMCGAKPTEVFVIIAVLLLATVILRGIAAHAGRDGRDTHAYLFLVQIASVFGLIGFTVYVNGAAQLNLGHKLLTETADAFKASGLESYDNYEIYVAVSFAVFAAFTLLSALYPFYAARRLGCQFTRIGNRKVSDSRISYAIVYLLPIFAFAALFGVLGYSQTNEITGNFISMVTGAAVMFTSELIVPIFRKTVRLNYTKEERTLYLCGDAMRHGKIPEINPGKPRIKPDIKIVDE